MMDDLAASSDDPFLEMDIARGRARGKTAQDAWAETRHRRTTHDADRAERGMPWLCRPPIPKLEGHGHCPCTPPDHRWDGDFLICQHCGVERYHLNQTMENLQWVPPEEFVPIRMPRRYAPATRFRTLLKTFLDNANARVGPVQERQLREALAARGVSPEACTGADIRRAIRSIREPDLYPLVPGIVAQIRGDPPLRVGAEQEHAAHSIFQGIIASAERQDRLYFVSYRTVMIDILEQVGVPHARVYCAELTHRRSRLRANRDARSLVRAAMTS